VGILYLVENFQDDIHFICANDNGSPIAHADLCQNFQFYAGVGHHFEFAKT
jgi:hypothetical protein